MTTEPRTAETPGTPLTPEEEAELRRLVNFSSMPHDAGCPVKWDPENGVCLCGQNTAAIQLARRATGSLIGDLLATLDRERRERVDPDPEWHKANSALPSMRCVCGHWDTEHAAFVSKVRPGRTRTFCDHCDCRSWMTPEDERAMNAARSRATDLLEATK